MKIHLSRAPDISELDFFEINTTNIVNIVPYCEEFVARNDMQTGQVCVFDMSNPSVNAPLIGVYWVEKKVFQTFQNI